MNQDGAADASPPAEPGYRLSISMDGDIFKAVVDGDIDAQSVRMAYWREILDAAYARHCRKLLVIDRKKAQPASPEELAALAQAFSGERDRFERIAVVEPTAAFLAAVEYGEIHARALGINIRTFSEIRNAERWLRFGSADD